ncbi:MAG: SH3 domain-containing protein [Chloroflexota bacterium]
MKIFYRAKLASFAMIVCLLALIVAGGVFGGTHLTGGTESAYAAHPENVSQAGPVPEGILAVVGADGGVLYDAPNGSIIENLGTGETLTAVGRSANNQWVVIYTDTDTAGWVDVSQLVMFGLTSLPVMMDADIEPPARDVAPANDTARTESSRTRANTAATNTPESTPTSAPTDTPTPTSPPTNTPTPTNSPTPTMPPTLTPTNTLVPGQQSTLLAVVGGRGANLWTQPNGNVLQNFTTGTAFTITGRSSDNTWLYGRTGKTSTGWIQASEVVAFNISSLPILQQVAQPQAVAQQAAVGGSVSNASSASSASASSSASQQIILRPTPIPAPITTQSTARTTASTGGTTGYFATVSLPEGNGRLNVRQTPGAGTLIIGKALHGEQYSVLGRSANNAWVQVSLPDTYAPYTEGWVSLLFISMPVDVTTLPVRDSSATSSTTRSGVAVFGGSSRTTATQATYPAQAPAPAYNSQPAYSQPVYNPPAPASAPAYSAPAASSPVVASTGPTGLNGKLVIQKIWGGEIYVYNLNTGNLRLLTTGYDPDISPDGTKVAFAREGPQKGIYTINIDGSNERRIFGEREKMRSPKWSPDGKWIVFTQHAGNWDCRDAGFHICLPNLPWFEHLPLIKKPNWDIARVDPNGENYRDIPAMNSALAPDWSNAGIVYQSSAGIQITDDVYQPIYDDDMNEIDPNNLVIFEHYYMDPDWQSNGGRIVFQSREGDHWEIFGVNPDGGGLAALTRPVTTLVDKLPHNVSPAWSPDNQMVVYISNRDSRNDTGDWGVWVMNGDGSNQRRLPINLDITYDYVIEQMVSWGP